MYAYSQQPNIMILEITSLNIIIDIIIKLEPGHLKILGRAWINGRVGHLLWKEWENVAPSNKQQCTFAAAKTVYSV